MTLLFLNQGFIGCALKDFYSRNYEFWSSLFEKHEVFWMETATIQQMSVFLAI